MNPSPSAKAAGDKLPAWSKGALFGLLGLAIGFIAGYGAGRVSTGTPINPLSDKKGGYEAGYQEAVSKLQGAAIPAAPQETRSLTGNVAAVSATSIEIDVDAKSLDPFRAKDLPARRTVLITDSTVVIRLEPKSTEEFMEEQRALEKRRAEAQPGDPPPAIPSPFKETSIKATDIDEGEHVTVEAEADILTAPSFEALKVTVAPSSDLIAAPLPPPPASPEASGAPTRLPGAEAVKPE